MLSSPHYPANYDNNDICVWNITAEENYMISLKFENFDVSKTVTRVDFELNTFCVIW